MKNKRPLSIRVIYWLTEVVFWLFILVLVLTVVLNIGIFSGFFGDTMQLHTSIPVEVDYTEQGTVEIMGNEQVVEYVESIGKLHFVDTNPVVAKWFGGVLMLIVIIGLYIFTMFRRFIGNVYRGYIFEEYNIQMLKKMAYGLVGLWIFDILYKPLFYYMVVKNIEFEHLKFSESYDTNGVILLVALFLWVLSHIFMYGVKLQREQELTV